MDRKSDDARRTRPGARAHAGRPFRGKKRQTSLPRPDPSSLPRPAAKDAERVAKVIARAGLGSRRQAEEWIAAGRVGVNGQTIASPAVNVKASDRITLDGKPLPTRERTRLFLYHKPAGLVTTTSDPQGRPTIFAALPRHLPRLVSVGRLDLNTEGLLLLTNDGGLARALELPETGWLRRYRVRAHGQVTQARLDELRKGIEVEGVRYGPIEATLDRVQGANAWITFAMREGKNREIRNVLGHLGLMVNRLIRVSYGPFQLGDLPDGAVEEVRTRTLREQLGEKIAALAGADFSAPIAPREPPAPGAQPQSQRRPERAQSRPDGDRERRVGARARKGGKTEEEKPRERRVRQGLGHVWRDRSEERSQGSDAPLKRKHASRRGGGKARPQQEEPVRTTRTGHVTDRKGRRIFVQRIGGAEEPQERAKPARRDRPRGGRPPRKPDRRR